MMKINTMKATKVLATVFALGLPFVSMSDVVLNTLLVIGLLLTITVTIDINRYYEGKYGVTDNVLFQSPKFVIEEHLDEIDQDVVRPYNGEGTIHNFKMGYTYSYKLVETCSGMPSLFQLVDTKCHYESMVEFDLDGLFTLQVFSDGSVNLFDFEGTKINRSEALKINIKDNGEYIIPSLILAMLLDSADGKLKARETATV